MSGPLQNGGQNWGQNGVGLHITLNRSWLVVISEKYTEPWVVPIEQGIDHIENCLTRVSDTLSSEGLSGLPVFLCVSGPAVQHFLIRTPKMSQALMLKAFRLQMKQQMGEEPTHLAHVPIWNQKTDQGDLQEYVVASIYKPFRDQVFQLFKKHQLNMGGWDVDLLAYYRVSDLLWRKSQSDESTRFLIILGKENCQLITISSQGQLLSTTLAMGVELFEEQPDPNFYLPLYHQVKTQLYATCNEYAIPLPTHFLLLGEGATFSGLKEGFANELGLNLITSEGLFPNDATGAVGAMVQRRSSVRFNFFPSRRKMLWRSFLLGLKRFRFNPSNLPSFSSLNLSEKMGGFVWLGVGGIALALLFGIPIYLRNKASDKLAVVKREYEKSALYTQQIQKGQTREKEYEKRVELIKQMIQKKRILSVAMKEMISGVSPKMRIHAVQFKGETLVIKGIASSHTDIQDYLKQAQDFKYLTEPVPLAMNDENEGASFEILFKVRQ